MSFSASIGVRYLLSKKRATISVITAVSVIGVALGVAALVTVLAVTTGFEREFQRKVLGVNAHVLIMKYGRDFNEYHDVLELVRADEGVTYAAPFVIREMMLAHKDRLSGVLVKGVEPDGLRYVLDVESQIIKGSADNLRLPDAAPISDEDSGEPAPEWQWLRDLRDAEISVTGAPVAPPGPPIASEALTRASKKPNAAVVRADAVLSPSELLGAFENLDELDAHNDIDEWEGKTFGVDEHRNDHAVLPSIIVGKTLADDLGIALGDVVSLVSPLSGLDVSIAGAKEEHTKTRDFRVIAVFKAGFQEYDSRLVYTDLYEAQRFLHSGDSVTGIELRVRDLNESSEVAGRLEQQLASNVLTSALYTLDWSELNRNLFTMLQVQKIALTLVIATIIFVAAFNVIASLIMIVLDKRKEIAILKAMGATDRTVLGIFVTHGVIIGVVGTAVGLLVGAGIVTYLSALQYPLDPTVYLIDHLPVVVQPGVFVLSALIAMMICTLSTLAPSFWAARLVPAEAMRYE